MNNFKKFRELNGESQQAVADFLGIDRSTYTKYETEQKAPPYSKIERLAQHWGTTVAALMGTDEGTKNLTGIPDEVYDIAQKVISLPPAAQTEALAYLDFLKQRYTRKKD